jgi:hypothetical protein
MRAPSDPQAQLLGEVPGEDVGVTAAPGAYLASVAWLTAGPG